MIGGLDTDSFVLKRVMRQEAHEKAFEIRVQTQRLFEKEKHKIVQEGKNRIEEDVVKNLREIKNEINIDRSTHINKNRMGLMQLRFDLMNKVLDQTREKIEEIAQEGNEKYERIMRDLLIQGYIKLLEKKVLVQVREQDLDLAKRMSEEAQEYLVSYYKEKKDEDREVEIEIREDKFIDPTSIDGKCGGLIMTNLDGKIVCENTLSKRLTLSYEEALPKLRSLLFPVRRE